MKPLSEYSAIELADAIRRADGAAPVLEEVSRLRGLLIDIIDICNTDPVTYTESTVDDYDKVLEKIDDIAHRYFNG